MAEIPGRLIIRTYAPARRYLLSGGAVLLGLLALYVAFEWGRYTAGYDHRDAVAKRGDLDDRIHELEQTSREQRLQIAAQESTRIGQTRERAEVSRTIGELQAQVARQAQDLAFYRGVVGDRAQAPPVTIQQLRIVAGSGPGSYALKIVLGRSVRPEDVINGSIGVTVEGLQGTVPTSIELANLSAEKTRELRFNFRFLQTLDQVLVLPSGFKPERTTVEIRANRKGVTPLRQTFLWKVEAA